MKRSGKLTENSIPAITLIADKTNSVLYSIFRGVKIDKSTETEPNSDVVGKRTITMS